MTRLTLDQAKNKGLPNLLDTGAGGEEIVIRGDGIEYRLRIIAEKVTQRAKRIVGLGRGNPSQMSDDFNDDDPEVNALFYGTT